MAIRQVSRLINPLTVPDDSRRTPTKARSQLTLFGVFSISTFVAFALSALSAEALPVIIPLPTVQITSLGHTYTPTSSGTTIRDAVDFPCGSGLGSCSSSGFSAAIPNGDEIIMRFEAPSGERFHVFANNALTPEDFSVFAGWQAGGDTENVFSKAAVNFENLTGTGPAELFNAFGVGNAGLAVGGDFQSEVSGFGNFTFTALTFTFSVGNSPPGATASFGAVGAPAFAPTSAFFEVGSIAGGQPDQILMQLEPIPEPSTALLLMIGVLGVAAMQRMRV